jgi:uncharacterized membrane protein YgcG
MAYERDTDRRTRGAGAIAAADLSAGHRQHARVGVGRATRQRDLAMAAVANGALGAVSRDPRPSRRVPSVIAQPRPAAGSGPAPLNIFGTSGALATGVVHAIPVTVAVAPIPPPPKPITAYDPTGRPPLPVPAPLPLTPLPPIPTTAPSAGTTTGSSAGSAGSGGTMSGGGGSVITTGGAGAPLMLPDLDPLPIPDAMATDHSTRNLLIAGGVGLAAYFLFFRRKS